MTTAAQHITKLIPAEEDDRRAGWTGAVNALEMEASVQSSMASKMTSRREGMRAAEQAKAYRKAAQFLKDQGRLLNLYGHVTED